MGSAEARDVRGRRFVLSGVGQLVPLATSRGRSRGGAVGKEKGISTSPYQCSKIIGVFVFVTT